MVSVRALSSTRQRSEDTSRCGSILWLGTHMGAAAVTVPIWGPTGVVAVTVPIWGPTGAVALAMPTRLPVAVAGASASRQESC